MSRVIRATSDEAASLGSFIVRRAEAGFRPRLVDSDPATDADRGSGLFEQETLNAEAAAYARGYDEGRDSAAQLFAAERDALARLAASLEVLRPEPANALALLLAETVDRLVREVVGEVDIDAGLLLARAKAAAELVAAEIEPTRLRVHPDDIVHLQEAGLAIALEADAGLARGSIVLETGHGWIEDGPAIRLERIRAELDKMAAIL